MHTVQQLKSEIVSACKILSKQKLVEGFGHVSARIPDSDRFLLTPRISLALVKEEDLLTLNLAGEVVGGNYPAPFESWLHVAIMKSQPRVGAITRSRAGGQHLFRHRPKTRAGAQSRQLLCWGRASFYQAGSRFKRGIGQRSVEGFR